LPLEGANAFTGRTHLQREFDLNDIPQIAGLLRAIFRLVEIRCNEIRLAPDCARSQIAALAGSKG
jgi:hypothetical protein